MRTDVALVAGRIARTQVIVVEKGAGAAAFDAMTASFGAGASGYTGAMRLRVAFERGLPVGRFGPLFHVLCLEEPAARLEWRATGFPTRSRPLLDGADVGLFTAPPLTAGLSALTVEESPMFVTMAVGHPLARRGELRVADVLDAPFPGGRDLHPEWRAFWTLDRARGGPPNVVGDHVANAEDGLGLVVSGRVIATVPGWVPEGLSHPGVIAVPLLDGPTVATRLVWLSDDDSPIIRALVDLARAVDARVGSERRQPVTADPPRAARPRRLSLTQAAAQAYFIARGGPAYDPDRLDADSDAVPASHCRPLQSFSGGSVPGCEG